MIHLRQLPALALGFLTLSCGPAMAHAFGARYDLPLPLAFYLTGAGIAVALTFVVLAIFSKERNTASREYSTDLTETIFGKVILHHAFRWLVNAVSISIFVLILTTGLYGSQSPIKNFGPTMVWVIWWVGLAFFAALIGNIWPVLNPWSALFNLAARFLPSPLLRRYPVGLGVWPSVILFLVFAWIEIVSDTGDRPLNLVCFIAAYSVLTWAGMAAFGSRVWLISGEVFNQAFGLLGRFAPLALKDEDSTQRRLVLRPYGVGLMQTHPVRPSMTAFVMVMLSTVTFDGFVETPAWERMLDWFAQDQTVRPSLMWLQAQDYDLLTVFKTVALLVFPCLFFIVYSAFCGVSVRLARNTVTFAEFTNTLVLSLVPIAIAYHVAHYLSYLLLAGQLIIPLASDPFGWGWDLFGTAHHTMDITIINAKTVWYTALVAIVVGHVLAVWIAHVQALALYKSARPALWSQIPILTLMVIYTMISLWILSQPIIER